VVNAAAAGAVAPSDLTLAELRAAYLQGRLTPTRLLQALWPRIDAPDERHVWISRLPYAALEQRARDLEPCDPTSLPLYGVPFAIKDNIDLEGLPTTAACPAFAYRPARSAHVVERLLAAGAIAIGKTNLDQFATGLVGIRSPYGACRNAYDAAYISGGSSSGSAVAVATGLVSFSLGTDTAGSGRVPAGFNNLLGFKPSLGRLSTRGVVPACRTLDTVCIFARNADDAVRVARVAEGFDADDPYSRQPAAVTGRPRAGALRLGVPQTSQLQYFGNTEYAQLFERALQRLESLGARRVAVDFSPFLETARLLYEGPWVAERYVVVEKLLQSDPASMHPVTRQIIGAAGAISAADAFKAQYRLQALRRSSARTWQDIDVLVTPTAGTIYRISEVEADPFRLNANLGYYTNFVNLLDLAAVAVPAGFDQRGLPFGITLIGPGWTDYELLSLAARFESGTAASADSGSAAPAGGITLAVCGAHMDGLPLNGELRQLGATFVERTRTAASYRLYALPGGPPQRPGLVRVASDGAAIEVELWSVPESRLGSFIAQIPAPLAIGKVQLADGGQASGFLCEACAVQDAVDITALGGWRAWLARTGL
jgi:allophanate hydrolase